MDKTEGFGCLGHSNWTICSLLSHFCSHNFPTFSVSYWDAISYYPRELILRKGNSCNFRNGQDRGVWVPGAFKLDHLQPVRPLLFPQFSNFFTFILGGQFLLPQRANTEKREFFQLQNWTRQRGLGAWGIRIGPFAACEANFIFKILQLFHFYTGGHFLLHNRANNEKREFSQLHIWMRQGGLGAWGIQTGPFAAC